MDKNQYIRVHKKGGREEECCVKARPHPTLCARRTGQKEREDARLDRLCAPKGNLHLWRLRTGRRQDYRSKRHAFCDDFFGSASPGDLNGLLSVDVLNRKVKHF